MQGATKDVAALKDKFKGLEQKLMELQQRLDAQVQENARLKDESQKQAYAAASCATYEHGNAFVEMQIFFHVLRRKKRRSHTFHGGLNVHGRESKWAKVG